MCIYTLNIVYSSGMGTSSYHNLNAGKLLFCRRATEPIQGQSTHSFSVVAEATYCITRICGTKEGTIRISSPP